MKRRFRILSISICSLVLILLCTSLQAKQPKFKNPNPSFVPLPTEEELRLMPIKLGKPPVVSDKQMAKMSKGDVLVQELEAKGDSRRYQAIGIIPAKPSQVMAFLKDYPARKGAVPHIEKITAKWDGNLAVVDMKLKIALTRISYRMQYLHYGDQVVEWEYLYGDLKDTSGYFKLFPMESGKKTMMVYHVFSIPGSYVPGFIIELLSKSSMPKVIKGMRKAILNRIGR